jgi:hypothetical protein
MFHHLTMHSAALLMTSQARRSSSIDYIRSPAMAGGYGARVFERNLALNAAI